MKIVTPEGIAITRRFFSVIDLMVSSKRIRGLQTFTRNHGISFSVMSELRNHVEIRSLKIEYAAYLCEDFNVNAKWLLTGKGSMFND